MNAGLPTTGIGGIFYFFSVLLMIPLELLKTFRGQSDLKSWSFVFNQTFLVSTILGTIWATAYILNKILPEEAKTSIMSLSENSSLTQNTSTLFLTPFILLAILISSTQALRIYFLLKEKGSNKTKITK